ncbi:LOW QUALITY PROTEIN: Wilms tumor protein 1-interacting protein-like [Leucoraja erinacea]|uniref:LOW QUALITY PROTEIN: Wilms tumor protein 1-interacting protein-like n=1 Tax=Leucoraja erinaceus TaxID=7782 RepID=UPI002456CC23|nr:LOW QUALITY PROTEIN: Wilms tumor protein 1-interacting protein-like [Leucoraja erinacea]
MSKYEDELAVQATFLQDLSLYEPASDGPYRGRRELLCGPGLEETKRTFLLQMMPGPPHHVLPLQVPEAAAGRMNGTGACGEPHDRGLGTYCKLSAAPRAGNGNRGGTEAAAHRGELGGEPEPPGCYLKGPGTAYGAENRRFSGGVLYWEAGPACGRHGAGYTLFPGASAAAAARGNSVSAPRSNNVSAPRGGNNVSSGRGGGNNVSSPRSSLASASSSSSNSTQEQSSKQPSPRSSLHPSPRSSLHPSPRSSLVLAAHDKYPSPRTSLAGYEGGGLSSRSSYASTASDTSKHSSPRASLNEGGGGSGSSRPSSNRTSGISMGYDQRHVSPRSSYSDGRFPQADADGSGPSARSSISSHSSRGSISAAYPDLQLPSPPPPGLPEAYTGPDIQPPCAGETCCYQRQAAGPLPEAASVHPYGYSPGKGPAAAHKIRLPYQVTPCRDSGPSQAEKRLEALTRELEKELELHVKKDYFGICVKCRKGVYGASQACQAMGNLYHTNCFICCSCGRRLRGKAFYNVNGKVYCEEDFLYSGFQQTADKCFVCGHLIMEMILQALGKSYHPGCFRCVLCNECLDGVPFTVDLENNIYCVKDYHTVFAPKCASCGRPILPAQGSEETIRVVSMDKDYHVECYRCEDCGLQLNDEEARRCYPLEGHLLCHSCHIRRINVPHPTQPQPPPGYQLHVTEL